jgi:hypothetical protein
MAEARWPYLLVLDLDEFTVRCRSCPWVSPPATTVQEARHAYAAHACPRRPVCSRWRLGWCAICGRVPFRGLIPANPNMPGAWVRTWVCADRAACRRRAGCSSG